MEEALGRWLGRDDLEIEQLSGGASNLTYRVRSGDDDWILRRPPSFVTKTSNDMRREWRVQQALAGTAVPVPTIVRTCEDDSVLGAPFYLMDRLDGIVPRTADDVASLDEAQSWACTEQLVDVLAAIHAVDVDAVGLGDLGRPQGFIARQLKRWGEQWEATKFDEVPEVDETIARLGRALPPEGPPSLVHGDYSFHNTLFHRDPPTQLQAVLDWEMSTLGDPLADVGYLAMMWGDVGLETMTEPQAHRANPGFGTTGAMLERYAATSGRDLGHIDFYVALATLKLGVIVAGARRRIGDADPERAAQSEQKCRRLAQLALEATDRLGV